MNEASIYENKKHVVVNLIPMELRAERAEGGLLLGPTRLEMDRGV